MAPSSGIDVRKEAAQYIQFHFSDPSAGYTGGNITMLYNVYEPTLGDLDRVAGRLDRDRLERLTAALKDGDGPSVWRLTREALSGVTTPEALVEQVLLELRAEVAKEVEETGEVNETALLRLEILSEALGRLRVSPLPGILAEVTLMRLASSEGLVSIGELLEEARSLRDGSPPPQATRPPRGSGKKPPVEKPEPKKSPPPGKRIPEKRPEPSVASPSPSPPARRTPPAAGPAELFRRIKEVWPSVVTEVRKKSVRTGEFLRTAAAAAVNSSGALVLEARGETTLSHLKTPAARDAVSAAIEKLCGFSLPVEVRVKKTDSPTASKARERAIEDEPIFRKAREIFRGGEE